MKIFWINHHAKLPEESGGNRHYELGRRLTNDHGYDVTVVRGVTSHLSSVKDKEVLKEVNDKRYSIQTRDGCNFVTVACSPCTRGSSISRIRNMTSFAKNTRKILSSGSLGEPDIVIGSVVHTFAAHAGLNVAKHFQVPFVYEVRDLWPLTPIEIGGYSKWHPFLLYLDYLDRTLAKSADLIITTAPLMKEYYKDHFDIPDEKFIWVTNGTDLELFKDLPVVEDNEEKDTFDIYYAGAHGHANGLCQIFDQLPKTVARYPYVRLTLVGDGPLKPKLKEQAEKENLPVLFLDAVPKTELPAILNKADALLVYLEPCSLYRYGISLNKLADYHAMGKPILFIGDCTKNPVIRSGAGIVARNVDEFPDALKKLILCGQEEKKSMVEKGHAFAKEHYDWGKLAHDAHSALLKIGNIVQEKQQEDS